MSAKPKTFNGDLRNLPAVLTPLTTHKRWVVWPWELRKNKDGKTHWTKPPRQPSQPGYNAKSNNPDTWGTYEDAVRTVEAGNADGIGYMLKDSNIAAVDLDRCVDDDKIDEWAEMLCQEAQGTYQEKTVSGTGLRIIGATANRQPLHKRFGKGNGAGVELYRNAERYITISGLQIGSCEQFPPIDDFLDALVVRNEREQSNGKSGFNNEKQQRSWFDYEDLIKNGCGAGDNRSNLFHSVVCHLAAYGMTVEEIIAKLARYPNGIGAKYAGRLDAEVRRSYEKWRLHQPAGNGAAAGGGWQWRFFGRQEEIVERPYLVDKLLPETGVGLISGQWGTYKTFVALDLGASVITGTPFAGFDIARRGAVLFVALEGEGEVAIRLRASLAHRGYTDKLAPFAWIDACPRLLDRDSGRRLTEMVKQAAERMLQDFNMPVVLVIVDTAGKAAGYAKAGDENDAVVGKQIVTAMAEASRDTRALFIGIDHFGKVAETGTRGSSAKESDCDAVLALLGDKSISGEVTNPRLAVRKRRSGSNGVEVPFRPRVVRAGEIDTTLVIDWLQADEAAPSVKADRWGKAIRLLRRTLMNVLVDHGTEERPFLDGPTVRAVDIEVVRAEFYKSHPAEGDAKTKSEARRKAFARAVKDAQAKELIGVRDILRDNAEITIVWLAGGEAIA